MEWLKRFMIGRYGVDQLSIALMVASILFSLLSQIIQNPVIVILYVGTAATFFYRVLSKDTARRSQENTKFLKMWNPIRNKINTRKRRLKDSRYYRYYKCSNCMQNLRVPKGKGKISITCPDCNTKMLKKS